ncbi:MAG: response regulator transcription factor [Oscillospiraceae bacterium]|nr:response regulator transcription factor [Oscillospiraceae bacterium]MDE7171092.1 response regulator transcription factor [Oscillospiraceae bacterium]
METANILVVEDDVDINRLLCTILEGAGYTCRAAFSGSEALLWAEKYDYDLILLDLMLPGVTGEELIARIRRGRTMPIIVASAKVGVSDRVNVLKLGADDFIPKPFDNAEVLARVEAQLRRSRQFASPKADMLSAGSLVLDKDSHTVTVNGEELSLTGREFDILALLMENPRRAFSRAQIYETVWGEDFIGDDNTVNVHVSNLRSKLAKIDPERTYIKTVWGIGFKFNLS